ncbi:DegT/DnrJ/EryC1/StrS family aminotransferase [Streptomyces sp. NPDC005017]|uniref:DegT/DnrJ/EryC1/StrS family aminotransferase n=1 Tax=Streptomyces sp. NPDC005017 TaxID=3364706 RepID=UPI0036B0950B
MSWCGSPKKTAPEQQWPPPRSATPLHGHHPDPRTPRPPPRRRERDIGVGVHYPPNHTQPAFAARHRCLPTTEQVGEEILSLPFHPHLTDTDIDLVGTSLEQSLNAAGGS